MGFHYDYKVAKSVLSEADWNRIGCVLLSSTDSIQPDWDRASSAYGSASINSFRIMYNNALKKIADAGGKYDKATNIAQPSRGNSKSPHKPKMTGKADAEGDDEENHTPRKKRSDAESDAGGSKNSKEARPQEPCLEKEILGEQAATPIKVESEQDSTEGNLTPKSALKRKGKGQEGSSRAKRVAIKEETDRPSSSGKAKYPNIQNIQAQDPVPAFQPDFD